MSETHDDHRHARARAGAADDAYTAIRKLIEALEAEHGADPMGDPARAAMRLRNIAAFRGMLSQINTETAVLPATS